MKQILFVATALDIGGVQRSLVSLLHAIDHSQFSVDLMLYDAGGELIQYLPEKVNNMIFK